jgi:hypothetical protein
MTNLERINYFHIIYIYVKLLDFMEELMCVCFEKQNTAIIQIKGASGIHPRTYTLELLLWRPTYSGERAGS